MFEVEEQPNVIGDYASLTLNNFVSTVGRHYMSDEDMSTIKQKAEACRLPVDLSPEASDRTTKRQPLIETLQRLDESTVIINNARIDTQVLRHLPFWRNYERWQNFLFMGLVFASDISTVNQESNERVKQLLERTEALYS